MCGKERKGYFKTHKTFIEVGINDFPNLLHYDNEVLSHHLFIFNGITYEALSFLLASYSIRLHGGSHKRRHLIQPLELNLIDQVRNILDYIKKYVEDTISIPTIRMSYNDEILARSVRLKDFRFVIREFYLVSDGLKMYHNTEYMELMTIYKKLFKLWFNFRNSRDILELMVLSQYKLTVKIGELVLEKQEFTKDFENKLLTDVEERLSKQSSNNLKIDKVQKRE